MKIKNGGLITMIVRSSSLLILLFYLVLTEGWDPSAIINLSGIGHQIVAIWGYT